MEIIYLIAIVLIGIVLRSNFKNICWHSSEIDDLENKTLTEIRNSLSNPEIDWNQLKFIAYTNKLLVPYKPKTNQKKEIPRVLGQVYNK